MTLNSPSIEEQGLQIVGMQELSSTKFALECENGERYTFESRDLRFQCPCASCVHEWTGKRMIQLEHIPADVHPKAIQSVGNYALQIAWSDGHATGIYTYERLKSLAQKN